MVHLGLMGTSRLRQALQLRHFIEREVPAHAPLLVAGDFNDWSQKLHGVFADSGLHSETAASFSTFPARLPLTQLDHIYARGLHRVRQFVPGQIHLPERPDIYNWASLSDHLPLVAEFALD